MKGNMKNTHWFPHPANLRNDRRMKRAMNDLPGGVGYGAIVLTLEVLRCEQDFCYPIEDLDLLAVEFGISLPILQTVVQNYGFFEIIEDTGGKMFVSPLLNDLMLPYKEKQKLNQIAGQISAHKRKLKQNVQLQLLSQIDSSQQVFNSCNTDVAHNREEKKREEKIKKSLIIEDFQPFKLFILKNYKEKIVCYGPVDFQDTTAITITSQSYLHNDYTDEDLSTEDACRVWKWMFENQDKLCTLA
jgi:hypothetical protein